MYASTASRTCAGSGKERPSLRSCVTRSTRTWLAIRRLPQRSRRSSTAHSGASRTSRSHRATNGKRERSALATEILVDTDVCIDHLRGARALKASAGVISYSVITRSELFAGRTNETRVDEFLAPFREIAVDRSIAERAGRLRRGSSLRTPDALIAATAIEHGLELVTRNRRDFEAIPGLRLR